MPSCGLWRGSSNGPVRPIFISPSSRPSRGAKPHGADDTRLPQKRPRQAGSRGGREIKAGVPREVLVMQAVTIKTRRAPGRRRPAQCPPFLFGAKGASAGESIKQRHPFRCNETKTSPTAGRKSLWSPSQRHHQSLWQARTNFSQDKCTRCSPSKWPIVGALPAQYLGGGPGPLPIYRTSNNRNGERTTDNGQQHQQIEMGSSLGNQ